MEDLRTALLTAVEKQRRETIDLMVSLLKFRTFGNTGRDYQKCASFIATQLKDAGLNVTETEVPQEYLEQVWGSALEKTQHYLPVKRWARRSIVMGKRPPTGQGRSLHLTQHYDIPGYLRAGIPVRKTGERIYGAAASRCRAGLIPMIMAAKALQTVGATLSGELIVSATPDNHLGGETGGGFLTAAGHGRSDLVITGSPGGSTTIGLGYKGAIWLRVSTYGQAALASEPHKGINAIDKMVAVHRALASLASSLQMRVVTWPTLPPEAGPPSLVAAQIYGGSHGVPDKCVMFIDRRVNPDESVASAVTEIEAAIAALHLDDDGFPVEVEVVHGVDSAVTPRERKLPQCLAKNIRSVLGVEPRFAVFPFYSEFRFFPEVWGAEAVNYGPGLTDDQWSGESEYVVIDDLVAATKVMALTICDVLSE
jgi:succinyl-diaminopimelate desuccinylase